MYENYKWKWWVTLALTALAVWGINSASLNLGLDLKGGAQLIYRLEVRERGTIGVQVREPRESDKDKVGLTVTSVQPDSAAEQAGIRVGDIVKKIDGIRQQSVTKFAKLIERDRGKKLELEWYSQAGAKLEKKSIVVGTVEASKDRLAENVIEVLKKRLDGFGLREMTIQKQGLRGIIIQVPGVTKSGLKDVKDVVSRGGRLDFRIVVDEKITDVSSTQRDNEIKRIFEEKRNGTYFPDDPYDIALVQPTPKNKEDKVEQIDPADLTADTAPRHYILVMNKGGISGDELAAAYRDVDQTGRACIGFKWNPVGARQSYKMTSENLQKTMAVTLDGNVVQIATIQGVISDRGVITGSKGEEEIRKVIVVLKGGALRAKPVLQSEEQVGPSIGRTSLRVGSWAIALSFLVVLFFMFYYYKGSGIIANVALVLNLVLILGILSVFEATLTLPGIAGILLTAGMAVDANILIFERIREEIDREAQLKQAIEAGYDRAFSTIFDANLTTFLTALVLFYAGTGPIKGFAVTLMVGILCSMFTALFVTKAIFAWMVSSELFTEMKMLKIDALSNASFDLMGQRGKWAKRSLIVVNVAFLIFVARGADKFGLDFTGGSMVQVSLAQPMSTPDMNKLISGVDGLKEVSVTMMGDPDKEGHGYFFQLKTREVAEEILKAAKAKGSDAGSDEGTLRPQDVFRDEVEKVLTGKLIEDAVAKGGQRWEVLEPTEVNGKKPKDKKRLHFGIVVKRPDSFADDMPAVTIDVVRKEIGKLTIDAAKGAEIKVAENDKSKPYVTFDVTTGNIMGTVGAQKAAYEGIVRALEDAQTFDVAQNFPRVSSIGASIAYNLKAKAAISVLFSLIVIVLYITIRFEFRYGLAAIGALAHDVIIALGFMAALDFVFSSLGVPFDSKINLPTIAAFLTIVGYSLNDTIVVFDRIRENGGSRKFKGEDEVNIVNASINQTLSRTILTSLTTFFVVAVLFVFSFMGLQSIQGLSTALLVGIVVGTYSSIFVASPLLLFGSERSSRLLMIQGGALVVIAILGKVLSAYGILP